MQIEQEAGISSYEEPASFCYAFAAKVNSTLYNTPLSLNYIGGNKA